MPVLTFFLGPKLPFKLYKSMMVSLPQLNELILIGGFSGQDPNSSTPSNAMIKLNNISMKWIIYNQTFKHKDLFDWGHNPSHSTLYPDVLKTKTIIVMNQNL